MASNGIVNLLFKLMADARGLKEGLSDAKKSTDEFTESSGSAFDDFAKQFGVDMDKVRDVSDSYKKTIGAISKATNASAKGTGLLSGALKILKVAMVSTGIGALVVALGSLVAYFTSAGEGANKLAQIIAGFKALIGVIVDRFAQLGKAIITVFSNPKQAIAEFRKVFKGIGQEIRDEISNAYKGAGEGFKIDREELNLQPIWSERKKQIQQSKLIAEDEKKSVKERISALKEATALELKTLEERKSIAVERKYLAQKEYEADTGNTDKAKAYADAMSEVNDVETHSLRVMTSLQKEINDLTKSEKSAYERLTGSIALLEEKRQAMIMANKDTSDITKQINALREQKKAVDDLVESLDKTPTQLREELEDLFDTLVQTRKMMATSFTNRYNRPINYNAQSKKENAKYEPIDTTKLVGVEKWREGWDERISIQQKAADEIKATNEIIESSFVELGASIGESLGNMLIDGGGVFDNLGSLLLSSLADLAITVGKIAIATGITVEAVKDSLLNFFGGGFGAIAAGIALVALGTAVKGAMASAAIGGGGGSFAGGSSGVYDTRSMSGGTNAMAGKQANALKVEIIGETSIRNKDIYIAYKNAETGRRIGT